MTWLSLRLPIPLSTNHAYANAKRWTRDKETGQRVSHIGRMLTEKAVAYRDQVGWLMLAQTTPEQREALPERLTLSLVYNAADDLDVDNGLKLLVDSLFAVLGRDDRTIWHLQVDRSEHAEKGMVGVMIGGSG